MARSDGATMILRTPEGIAIPLALADPARRFLAWLLDRVCIFALAQILGVVLQFTQLISRDFGGALLVLMYAILALGYPIGLEWFWNGQTLGKRLLRIRVMDESALRLHFSQVVMRNLLRAVDVLPGFYLVGGVAAMLNDKSQRLGDLAANTVVVRTARTTLPDVEQVMGGKYNSFHDYPHLVARLRQSLSSKEAGVLLRAILRRETLDPDDRVALYAELAADIRALVPFPPECIDGLSDEHYLQNTVDVLFNRGPSVDRE